MVWTEQHGILFLRKILNIRPWLNRHGNVKRRQAWDEIAAILNSLDQPFLKSLQDQFVTDTVC